MRYVLDTNIVAASFNGHPGVIGRLNRTLKRDRIFLPAMALAELRFGAFNSRKVSENLARITNDQDLQDGAISTLEVEDWLAPLS